MPDPTTDPYGVPLSALEPGEKALRASSFGGVADHYERFRPGPTAAAIDWLLPDRVGCVVDLGAGTGGLTRQLLDRADDVVAIEPDDRMRAVLGAAVPGIRALAGTGEAIPLPDASAHAVLASSSWHWMEPVAALGEVRRVLVPGGVLGCIWSGPDPEGPFLLQARALMEQLGTGGATRADAPAAGDGAPDPVDPALADLVMGDGRRPTSTLEIPEGVPFAEPEQRVFTRDVALTADDLIGLLGTFSWIITMPEETRARVFEVARRLLCEFLGVEGEVTVDVAYRTEAWRSTPLP